MVESKPLPADVPGGKAARMTYTVFKVGPAGEQLQRSVATAESIPMPGGSWLYAGTEMTAPDAHFDADAVTMQAIIKSVRPNQAVMDQHQRRRTADAQAIIQNQNAQLQAIGQQNLKDQQARFEAGQAAHREQQASFDKYNQGWKDRQYAQDRSNDNFVELLRGTRAVYDTRTDTRSDVSLYHADGLAQALNEQTHDPDRFVSVPLRDENHPLR